MSTPPTWLLLRGLTRDARHWGGFGARLSQGLGGVRVVEMDLPGNGSLHAERSPTSVDAMAAHCRAQWRQWGAAAGAEPGVRLRVLAMSLGAMVATAWAARHPEEIDALVLINASMRPVSPFYRRLRARHYARLLRLLATGADALDWERTILQITSHHRGGAAFGDEIVREWAAHRVERPVTRANALRQLVAAARFRAPAALHRSLLLASAADALVDPSCSAALARRWNAPIAIHPWAGHDLPLDDADWVVEHVRDWLAAR